MISANGERKIPAELSRMSETSAKPTGPRFAVPPKMTSSIFAPRSDREDCSPSTQRIASEIFDLPEPFGPTIAVMPPRNLISVRSGNDLKPCKIRLLRTMFHLEDIDKIFYHKGRQNSTLYRRQFFAVPVETVDEVAPKSYTKIVQTAERACCLWIAGGRPFYLVFLST